MEGTGAVRRVAVFVDGDNLSVDHAPMIAASAEALGSVTLRRVYGRASALVGWDAAPEFRGVRVGGGKNGTDLLLSIEAVEAAMQGRMEAAVLASDDRDFSHLACWLREHGHFVLGIGTPKSAGSTDWRTACSSFLELQAPPVEIRPLAALDSTPPLAPECRTDGAEAIIREIIRSEGRDGAIRLTLLGDRAKSRFQGIEGAPGSGRWKKFFEGRPAFKIEGQGPTLSVRLLRP